MSKTAINPDNYTVLSENTIKALKSANQVNFYLKPSETYQDSEMVIYLTNDHHEYLKVETKAIIDGDGWQPWKNYKSCRASASYYNHEFKTFRDYLRKGDMIRMQWAPDHGTNGYAKAVGLHVDYLYAEVVRKDKITRFVLDVSTCPNNSARMCQVTYEKQQRQREETKKEQIDFDYWYDMGLDRPKQETT